MYLDRLQVFHGTCGRQTTFSDAIVILVLSPSNPPRDSLWGFSALRNAGQAIGLADGVVRSIVQEREAMDNVQRALRQRKKLISQYQDRDDETDWTEHLTAIEQAADARKWSEASDLLSAMNQDLDKEGKASEEALELYDFVMDEWRILRNQSEAIGIKVKDDDRRLTEQAIAEAGDALSVGRIEDCLEHLGSADASMERLRRRI